MVILNPALGLWDKLDRDVRAMDKGGDGVAWPKGGLIGLCLRTGWTGG